ncbi:MAG: FixH family protein [Proteobacteria bacterium]|nr:FixH family protein [Pseudomonadota bacterium]
MRALSILFAVSCVVGLAGGCGGDDDEGSQAANQSTAAGLRLTLVFEFDPPVVGQNRLSVSVSDDAGAPVTGAQITVDPQMPHMGHGSTEEATVSELGGGSYDAFPVTFQMPGMWEVTVGATKGALSASETIKLMVE